MSQLTRDEERDQVLKLARQAKNVAPILAQLSTPRKNEILLRAAENLVARTLRSSRPMSATSPLAARPG